MVALHSRRSRGKRVAAAVAVVAGLACLAVPASSMAAGQVKVMTRNVYLGADLTPGVKAKTLQQLVDAAGKILHRVDQNKFPVRAKGLAAEILKKKPDLVGLQEAALWRTQPCNKVPSPPSATHVRYDYLKRLLAQLNKNANNYRLVISQNEFDFEIWTNTDGNDSTHGPGCPFGSEINGRLTMRDAILARVGHVTTSNPKSANFDTLMQVKPGGVPFNIARGWTAVDAKVPGAGTFRFVNTHLESFDSSTVNHTNKGTDVSRGEIRETQAKELVHKGGAASGKLPVILLGDLNSDIKTERKPGDGLAYDSVLAAGFVERSTSNPLGCCLKSDLLTVNGGGKVSDFDHKVDHIVTNRPNRITLLSSAVTGRKPVNGFWDSDHAGLFSALSLH